MKTSEAWAMLEKNPKLKFIGVTNTVLGTKGILFAKKGGDDRYYPHFTPIDNDGKEIKTYPLPGGLRFFGNVSIETDWTLIPTPVPWQDAIQAWTEGKTIKCECPGCIGSKCFEYVKTFKGNILALHSFQKQTPVCQTMLTHGVWYIEEGEIE